MPHLNAYSAAPSLPCVICSSFNVDGLFGRDKGSYLNVLLHMHIITRMYGLLHVYANNFTHHQHGSGPRVGQSVLRVHIAVANHEHHTDWQHPAQADLDKASTGSCTCWRPLHQTCVSWTSLLTYGPRFQVQLSGSGSRRLKTGSRLHSASHDKCHTFSCFSST